MTADVARSRHWDGEPNNDSAIASSAAISSHDTWQGAGLLTLRGVLGATFLLHGIQNLTGAWTGWDTGKMGGYLASKGFGGSGELFAWITAIVEVISGTLLLLGLFTSLGAAVVVIMMATSTKLKLSAGFFMPGGFEWDLAVLGGGLALLLAGAGRFSIDHAKVSPRTQRRIKQAAVILSIAVTILMVVITWGAPPPPPPPR
jgi:putative oxidoreductase